MGERFDRVLPHPRAGTTQRPPTHTLPLQATEVPADIRDEVERRMRLMPEQEGAHLKEQVRALHPQPNPHDAGATHPGHPPPPGHTHRRC